MKAMPKQEKIIIRTPFPTHEEIVAFSGLPAKRLAELDAMIVEIRREIEAEKAKAKRSRATRTKKSKRR